MEKLKIEFQYFEGCPNHEKLHNNLLEAVKEFEDKIDIKYILIDNDETARSIGFRGSPKLLINGEDIEGMTPQTEPSLSCRFYKSGIPSPDTIRMKLLNILKENV
ncbi:MAG: DUF2703 domain-containing protein [Ignavibacteria bacterium]|nr:DUF2703 domain-containing protein [Ignavibacteria bacterium]